MADNTKLYYKTCREQAGLTQEQAAYFLHIDVGTLSRYENGHLTVPADTVRTMVQIYRTPLLANWHIKYVNPELADYLPELTEPITDGDVSFQMELADDDITEVRAAIKAILRNGIITPEEAFTLKIKAKTLREIANKILSAAAYLECREVTKGENEKL